MFRTMMGVAAASLLLSSPLALADTATCPDELVPEPNVYDRDISLTSDADVACYEFGSGNIPSSQDVNFADASTLSPGVLLSTPGQDQLWTWIDTWDVTGNSSENGFLSVEGGAISLNSGLDGLDLGVLIKVGGGTADPDWAFFTLSAFDDLLTALISGGNGGGISHVSIFCKGTCEPEKDVPEPATLGLLGLGLAGLGLGVRRRRKI